MKNGTRQLASIEVRDNAISVTEFYGNVITSMKLDQIDNNIIRLAAIAADDDLRAQDERLIAAE